MIPKNSAAVPNNPTTMTVWAHSLDDIVREKRGANQIRATYKHIPKIKQPYSSIDGHEDGPDITRAKAEQPINQARQSPRPKTRGQQSNLDTPNRGLVINIPSVGTCRMRTNRIRRAPWQEGGTPPHLQEPSIRAQPTCVVTTIARRALDARSTNPHERASPD